MNTKRIHVISNTHWDREHRHAFQETRIMLVETLDKLIEIMENDHEYKYFTLDGQSIIIDDYLEIKPFMRERLERLIRSGRLLVGPWYSLLDCNSASGESIVRNLLKGITHCNEFGGAMKLGYSIFSFGQIAQLPQLYSGFGIDTIFFYKNPDRTVLPKSEFFWVAPDGTKALASRLGRLNRWNFTFTFSIPVIYGGNPMIPGWEIKFTDTTKLCHMADDAFKDKYAGELQPDIMIREDKIVTSVRNLLDSVEESVSKHIFLGFDGTDFTMPSEHIPEAIRKANSLMAGEVELLHSNPVEYVKDLKADIDTSELLEYTGEMRFGPIHAVHSEVLAANVELKQLLFKAENTLLYIAEPWMVFCASFGYQYKKEILDKAWIYMFQALSHDSIHGSGVPKLKPDNLFTLAQAEEIAQSVSKRAIENVVKEINIEELRDDDIFLAVFNPTPYERSEIFRVFIDLPENELFKDIWLEETYGEKLETYRYYSEKFRLACVSNGNRPKTVYSDRICLDANVKNIPAYGYKVILVKREKGDFSEYQPFTPVGVFPHAPIGFGGNILDNGLLRITINSNGSVDIFDYTTSIFHTSINVFTDSGCSGNPWAHKMPDNNSIISSIGCQAEIAVIENSYLSATYKVAITMDIPKSLDSYRKSRSQASVSTRINTEISLSKNSKRVDFKTYFENRCKDHLFTVRFPIGIRADKSHSECPFEVRERPIGTVGLESGIVDDRLNLTRHMMHNFIGVSDGITGAAVFTKGLKECMVSSERNVSGEEFPVIVLTLLRAVSNTIPIHDDLFVDFSEEPSQCIGKHCFEYALEFHEKDWFSGKVIPASRKYMLPLMAAQFGRGKGGKLPLNNSFMELTESKLVFSGMKLAEDGNGIIIRLYNPSEHIVSETIRMSFDYGAMFFANMDETIIEKIDAQHNEIKINAPPYKIITLRAEHKISMNERGNIVDQ